MAANFASPNKFLSNFSEHFVLGAFSEQFSKLHSLPAFYLECPATTGKFREHVIGNRKLFLSGLPSLSIFFEILKVAETLLDPSAARGGRVSAYRTLIQGRREDRRTPRRRPRTAGRARTGPSTRPRFRRPEATGRCTRRSAASPSPPPGVESGQFSPRPHQLAHADRAPSPASW